MNSHDKSTPSYRPNREASEQVIHMLCEQYPKCFFNEPRQRRPLKQNIVADIIKDKTLEVSAELLNAAVEFYKNHIGYKGFQMSIPGVKRIDLDGKEVGTVTEAEAIAGQQELDNFHREANERQNPVRVLREMHSQGQISDCGVKKQDAPMLHLPKSRTVTIAPEFTALYEVLINANTAVGSIADPAMRSAVAKTLLDMVIQKAQLVRTELDELK